MAENLDIPVPIEFRTYTQKSVGLFTTNYSYVCKWKPFTRPNALKLGKWKLTPTKSNIPRDDPQAIQNVHPVLEYNSQNVNTPPHDKIQITWIGHATVLVQIEGLNILADPVFSEKCGPAGFGVKLGYERFTDPACKIDDLPPIDVVIISHNHHDHLDSQSVRDIARLHPKAKWLVGLGNKKFCVDKGCADVEELKWWESISIGTFRFVCTPTQHWCQRYPLDFNHALWCGWVVESPNYKYYFAGDTGYHDELFKLIGNTYGPFDLASIPIGAYEPRYITEFQYVNPEEAVKVHKDINSKISVGMHWGTFELTDEYYLEPPQELETQMYMKNLDPKTFFNLQIGETWIVGENRDYDPPFMEREKTGTQRLNYDRPDGDLRGFTTVATLQDPLPMVDALCQDIKTESQVKKIECSHPRNISPDGPSSHNNHTDLATITVKEPTVPSKRSMARDAQWSHNTQEDSASVVKPTGRSKPRSMALQDAFQAPWPHNNQEDSAIGMKPTGRSKPKRSLSSDAPLQRNNQDSASGIKPTGRSARD